MSDSVRPHRQQPTRLPRPWDSPGKNTAVGCHFLLQCIKWKVKVKSLSRVRLLATHGLQPTRLLLPWDFPGKSTGVGCHCLPPSILGNPFIPDKIGQMVTLLLLLLLSRFSCVWLCATPQTAAHQAPPSLGFSRQEHWSGLPFPSPMHESEKWNWSRSVVSNS